MFAYGTKWDEHFPPENLFTLGGPEVSKHHCVDASNFIKEVPGQIPFVCAEPNCNNPDDNQYLLPIVPQNGKDNIPNAGNDYPYPLDYCSRLNASGVIKPDNFLIIRKLVNNLIQKSLYLISNLIKPFVGLMVAISRIKMANIT